MHDEGVDKAEQRANSEIAKFSVDWQIERTIAQRSSREKDSEKKQTIERKQKPWPRLQCHYLANIWWKNFCISAHDALSAALL